MKFTATDGTPINLYHDGQGAWLTIGGTTYPAAEVTLRVEGETFESATTFGLIAERRLRYIDTLVGVDTEADLDALDPWMIEASLSDLHAKIRIPIRPGRSADEASCEVDA